MAKKILMAGLIGIVVLVGCAAPTPEPMIAPPAVRAPAAPSPSQPLPPPVANMPAASPPDSSAPSGASVTVIAPDKPAPPGDIRSVAERRRDRQAFDRCVIKAQAQLDSRGPGAMTDTPEEICRRQMGMRDRQDVPLSKQ